MLCGENNAELAYCKLRARSVQLWNTLPLISVVIFSNVVSRVCVLVEIRFAQSIFDEKEALWDSS